MAWGDLSGAISTWSSAPFILNQGENPYSFVIDEANHIYGTVWSNRNWYSLRLHTFSVNPNTGIPTTIDDKEVVSSAVGYLKGYPSITRVADDKWAIAYIYSTDGLQWNQVRITTVTVGTDGAIGAAIATATVITGITIWTRMHMYKASGNYHALMVLSTFLRCYSIEISADGATISVNGAPVVTGLAMTSGIPHIAYKYTDNLFISTLRDGNANIAVFKIDSVTGLASLADTANLGTHTGDLVTGCHLKYSATGSGEEVWVFERESGGHVYLHSVSIDSTTGVIGDIIDTATDVLGGYVLAYVGGYLLVFIASVNHIVSSLGCTKEGIFDAAVHDTQVLALGPFTSTHFCQGTKVSENIWFLTGHDGSSSPDTDAKVITFGYETPTIYYITPSYTGYGYTNPATRTEVILGASQAFTMTPVAGYSISDIQIDSASIASQSTPYTFSDVRADHTLNVDFRPKSYRAGSRVLSRPDS